MQISEIERCCARMKPLERIFFMACVNEQKRVLDIREREFSVRSIGNIFERLGFSYKQLMYYVQKWSNNGFYDYGTTLDLGWFNFEKLNGEYLSIYNSMSTCDTWKNGEFAQYIVKETHKNNPITNFAMRNLYGIGVDNEFYEKGVD